MNQPRANFNSRPCERGFNDHADHASHSSNISIHAPARGASTTCLRLLSKNTFQFTPLREGLRTPEQIEKDIPIISIHAPARGASKEIEKEISAGRISIHAPARGASQVLRIQGLSLPFQFTPLREGLRLFALDYPEYEVFQFTPLREGLRVY